MEIVAKLLAIFVVFHLHYAISYKRCNFVRSTFRSVRKRCMLAVRNATEIKHLGLEVRVRDDKETRQAFRLVKADFRKFYHGPVTDWNHRCDCTRVPCLKDDQVNIMFAFAIEKARKQAKFQFPFLTTLCCPLQKALVEIVYRLEREKLSELVKVTWDDISMQKWKAFVNRLQQTDWCKLFSRSCKKVVNSISRGCKVRRNRNKRNAGLKSATTVQTFPFNHAPETLTVTIRPEKQNSESISRITDTSQVAVSRFPHGKYSSLLTVQLWSSSHSNSFSHSISTSSLSMSPFVYLHTTPSLSWKQTQASLNEGSVDEAWITSFNVNSDWKTTFSQTSLVAKETATERFPFVDSENKKPEVRRTRSGLTLTSQTMNDIPHRLTTSELSVINPAKSTSILNRSVTDKEVGPLSIKARKSINANELNQKARQTVFESSKWRLSSSSTVRVQTINFSETPVLEKTWGPHSLATPREHLSMPATTEFVQLGIFATKSVKIFRRSSDVTVLHKPPLRYSNADLHRTVISPALFPERERASEPGLSSQVFDSTRIAEQSLVLTGTAEIDQRLTLSSLPAPTATQASTLSLPVGGISHFIRSQNESKMAFSSSRSSDYVNVGLDDSSIRTLNAKQAETKRLKSLLETSEVTVALRAASSKRKNSNVLAVTPSKRTLSSDSLSFLPHTVPSIFTSSSSFASSRLSPFATTLYFSSSSLSPSPSPLSSSSSSSSTLLLLSSAPLPQVLPSSSLSPKEASSSLSPKASSSSLTTSLQPSSVPLSLVPTSYPWSTLVSKRTPSIESMACNSSVTRLKTSSWSHTLALLSSLSLTDQSLVSLTLQESTYYLLPLRSTRRMRSRESASSFGIANQLSSSFAVSSLLSRRWPLFSRVAAKTSQTKVSLSLSSLVFSFQSEGSPIAVPKLPSSVSVLSPSATSLSSSMSSSSSLSSAKSSLALQSTPSMSPMSSPSLLKSLSISPPLEVSKASWDTSASARILLPSSLSLSISSSTLYSLSFELSSSSLSSSPSLKTKRVYFRSTILHLPTKAVKVSSPSLLSLTSSELSRQGSTTQLSSSLQTKNHSSTWPSFQTKSTPFYRPFDESSVNSASLTDLAPTSTSQHVQYSSSESNTVLLISNETYLVELDGNCSVIESKEAFKIEFIVAVTTILRIPKSDVVVNDVMCGSLYVIFTIKAAHSGNITSVLWHVVRNESFVIDHHGTIFVARDVKHVQPPFSTKQAPSLSSTEDNNALNAEREKKKIAFIIFVLIAAVFAALSLFSLVIFSSRFCACCQKSEKAWLRRRRATQFELELKRFTARREFFFGSNFYGDMSLVEEDKKEGEQQGDVVCDYEEQEDNEDQLDTTRNLLNHGNHSSSNKFEQKFVFDDDDSCSSVLFY